MKTSHFLSLATLLFLATANAATVAVLEITIASNDDEEIGFTVDETKFLSDELRRQAMRILPKDSVLTREKILSLIPETAENLNSVIDIGMVIKSDYVTRGSIGKLGNLFTLTVELYETASGKMLGDFIKESSDLKELLNAIRENAPGLFTKIAPETAKEPQPTSIPTNIPAEPKKSKTSFLVAIGLDALGATAIGLGIYSNAKAGKIYGEYKKLLENIPNPHQYPEQYAEREKESNAKYTKTQNAKTTRNIFYATGTALLLGGIAVHIWF